MIDDTVTSRPVPPAAQRVAGLGRLFCGKSDGRTRLQRLYQDGSAKIRLACPISTIRPRYMTAIRSA